ncbi:MAG: RNA 2',3'-cyclic phosphodiesterase [Planctomycetes bacterium]|nr:RNA 2',3'-cyclic phosphodiesterase [Planctomycetota bacterium]
MDDLRARLRLFVGLPLPDPARDALAVELRALRELDADVRWTRVDQLHVTLVFVGEVGPDLAVAIRGALRAMPWPAPLPLGLAGLGRFPARGPARVVWAGVAGPREALDATTALATSIAQVLEPLGIKREARPFHAHVTLGRVRGQRNLRALEAAVAHRSDAVAVTFPPIDRATLWSSERRPEGSHYAVVEEFALR